MAGTFWNCGTCGFYNFGCRTDCFACKDARGNAKVNKTGGPSSKPGSLARKPGSPATKAGEPPTKSGSNDPTNQNGLLTEQTLRQQIRAAKDDPQALNSAEGSADQAHGRSQATGGEGGQATQGDRGGSRETGSLQRGAGYRYPQNQSLPPDTVPVPKPSPATYLASSSALEQLLECAKECGDATAKALAEKVDQERKATTALEQPGAPARSVSSSCETGAEPTTPQARVTEQGENRAPSPGRGSLFIAEQGTLATLRALDTGHTAIEARIIEPVVEREDEDMED
eukprot:6467432-Amphidinium_carterae.1